MKFFAYLYYYLLQLRYNFHISWYENIDSQKHYIIFPNHQALVDPQIVVSIIGKKISLSPVISETYYNIPILKFFFKIMGAVSMWDIQRGTGNKESIKNAYNNLEKWVQNKKNILLYPSWQLYSQWFEVIRWKKTAHHLVSILPKDTEILLVKTTGLWGSIWSKAWDGNTPNFAKTFLKTFFILLGNIFFLTPKRSIFIEIKNATKELKNIKNLDEFNNYLENFYNKDWEEEVLYKKHFFYFNNTKNKTPPKIIVWSLKESWENKVIDENLIPQEIKEKIISKIAEMKKIDVKTLSLSSFLINDLYFDSLDSAEIKSYIQLHFKNSSNPPITSLKTIWDLCMMALWKSENQENIKPCSWWENKEEKNLFEIIQKNQEKLWNFASIPALFKAVFSKNQHTPFVYDSILGMQTRKDFLIKVYLLSWYIKKIEWKYIGIMLPSLSSSSLLIMATYFAWKTPVMLNWTLWETSLLHSVQFANLDTILTSKNFYDKVKNEATEKLSSKYIFLEEFLKNISIWKKISALLQSIFFQIPRIHIDNEAVILFTSGSESLPKAVPLTHKNLISDILWSLYHFPITQADILLGFLPPFHSFWFTINTIMPLISGLKVAYTPDPNDAKNISNIITHCQISALTSTPTFLKMILKVSTKNDIKTLKYAVVWAEKCPKSLAEIFTKYCPNGKILEWYGITECSPVISINPPNKAKLWSVWLPIFWSDIKIISLENNEILWNNQEGMIYFSGDNVFSWYLDKNLENPFEEIEGKTYYKTGDLWYKDDDGYLYITGRLKRFIKIAGEMISLPFIENILIQKYGLENENILAIEAKEENGNIQIVLFSTKEILLEEAQNHLRNSWVSNLVKLSKVEKIDEIPILGTGKIDYKVLKNKI